MVLYAREEVTSHLDVLVLTVLHSLTLETEIFEVASCLFTSAYSLPSCPTCTKKTRHFVIAHLQTKQQTSYFVISTWKPGKNSSWMWFLGSLLTIGIAEHMDIFHSTLHDFRSWTQHVRYILCSAHALSWSPRFSFQLFIQSMQSYIWHQLYSEISRIWVFDKVSDILFQKLNMIGKNELCFRNERQKFIQK